MRRRVEEKVEASKAQKGGGVLKYFCVALSSIFGVLCLRALLLAGDRKYDKRAGKARVDFRLQLEKNHE